MEDQHFTNTLTLIPSLWIITKSLLILQIALRLQDHAHTHFKPSLVATPTIDTARSHN